MYNWYTIEKLNEVERADRLRAAELRRQAAAAKLSAPETGKPAEQTIGRAGLLLQWLRFSPGRHS